MKVCANVFPLGLLVLIYAWGLSGCSHNWPATPANAGAANEETARSDQRATHVEPATAEHEREEHVKHDHDEHHGPASHGSNGHGTKSHDHQGHSHAGGEHKHRAPGEHKNYGHGEHQHSGPAPHSALKVGDKVPDFSVKTLDGKSVKLSELRKDERRAKQGVVVLSFWCSTCHSCRDVEHALAELVQDYAGRAAVLALDANANETAQDVANFIKKNGLDLPVVLDPQGHTADLFGVSKTTTTVVIDGNGVLRFCGQFQHRGGGSAKEALNAVLAGKEVAVKATPQYG
jgi:peroxiredoxin